MGCNYSIFLNYLSTVYCKVREAGCDKLIKMNHGRENKTYYSSYCIYYM